MKLDPKTIHYVALAALSPGPTNPRKHCNETKLRELADSLKAIGVIHPLLVRPIAAESERFEIVAGHRRYRAAQIAEMETLPVMVAEMSDEHVIECQLIENLQREDLDPIEEAESLRGMLDLATDGQARWTTALLAEKLGKSEQHVLDRLRLLRLPSEAKRAVQAGKIGDSIGALIAKVPSASLRRRLTGEVLRGFGDGPMSAREVRDHIQRSYCVMLRATPFEPKDAKLVPVKHDPHTQERMSGGACVDCPFNSANMPESGEQRTHLCTLPTCYAAKVEAHGKHVKEAALASGAVVIEGEKARRYVYHDGTPTYESGMIDLDGTPSVAETVSGKKAPTWKKMLSGKVTPKMTVVINERGRAHQLVERKLAIEAAKKNGYEDIFTARATRAKSPAHAEQSEREANERAKKKLEAATASEALGELVGEIAKSGLDEKAWRALVKVALFHAAADALAFVCHRREIDGKDDREKAVAAHAATLSAERVPALVVELLLAGWMKFSGIGARGFTALAGAYGLDVAAIKARVKAGVAAKKKPKKKPEPPAKPVREMIAELAKRRGLKSLAAIDELANKTCGKKYVALQGSQLTALLEAIRELPVPVKSGKKKKAAK